VHSLILTNEVLDLRIEAYCKNSIREYSP